MTGMKSNDLMAEEPGRNSAGEELGQANAKLEQENARLRDLLAQAAVDVGHTTEAIALESASSRELAAIVASSSDAIISQMLDSTITSWNTAAERVFGYTDEEMLGQSILRLIPFERHSEEEDILARVVAGEILPAFETIRTHKDGQPIEVSVVVSPVFDGAGAICGASKIVRDITQRKRDEERLRSSEEFARTVLESSPDCLKVIGADGRVEYVNQKGACLLEIDCASSIVGEPWESFWPSELRPKIRQSIEAAKAGQLIQFTAEAPTLKGTTKSWDVSITAIPSQDGQPIKLLATSRDVTEKTRFEQALVESEARFRAAVQAVDGVVWTNSANGEMTGEQPYWSALTGQTFAEYQGLGWLEALHPDDAQPTIQAWNSAVTARHLFEFEHRLRHRDGHWRSYSVRAVPIFDGQNQIIEWVGIHADISAQKASEAHMRLLMRELAHRSKNQLAVIQGVASQSARHASSLDAFNDIFAKRLQGMAISTDLLVSQQWDGAPLGDLVRRQLEPFGIDLGGFLCDGPDVFLGSDESEAIGLALHELATNCVKYGAWSVPAGLVEVSWILEVDNQESIRLRVNWTERGGPAVTAPNHEGFGRRVIERMVAQKLGGTVELAFDVEGLSWTLSAPHIQSADARADAQLAK